MRIVHFSDWHGQEFKVPAADLYVCSGDMLPNFRVFIFEKGDGATTEWHPNMSLLGEPQLPCPVGKHRIMPPIHDRESALQERFLRHRGRGFMRGLLHSRDAAVICCRGNHDFTDLAPMFGDGEVFEISEDPTRVFARDFGAGTLKFGGLRGVRAHRRRWSDELRHEEFADRVRRLPIDLDVLVTHAPPKGVLDKIPGQAVGSFALRSYVSRHDPSLPPLLAHLFGHIHEAQGVRTLGSTIFSNASGGWNVIDL